MNKIKRRMRKLIFTLTIIMATSLILSAQMSSNSLYADNTPTVEKDGSKTAKANTNKAFEVSANPANESVSVKFNVNANIESVKMISNNSSIVFETGKTRGAAGSVIDIPVEDMEPGTYFVRVQTETGIEVQRIIISK